MGFTCGIVGLPNVGKSTIFNALTATTQAETANYPFSTIKPHAGRAAVPDNRLKTIGEIAKSAQSIPTYLDFTDIAGLVRGASKGDGLGNQFLGNIREVDAILHVLRCFEDDNIAHIHKKVDPVADAETVETELMISDLENLERRFEAAQKRSKQGDTNARDQLETMELALTVLRQGHPVRHSDIEENEKHAISSLQLLTAKPVMYICNVDESSAARGNDLSNKVSNFAMKNGARHLIVSAAIEEEIAQIETNEYRAAFLNDMGLLETGLSKTIRAGYELLNLITFFTCGPKETRAWTVPRGASASDAAAEIHTDFERGFIRAETISYNDFVESGGETKARDTGKMRAEGRDYQVQDGDIMLFRFNV